MIKKLLITFGFLFGFISTISAIMVAPKPFKDVDWANPNFVSIGYVKRVPFC